MIKDVFNVSKEIATTKTAMQKRVINAISFCNLFTENNHVQHIYNATMHTVLKNTGLHTSFFLSFQ